MMTLPSAALALAAAVRGVASTRRDRSGIHSNAHACRAPEDDARGSRPPTSAPTCPALPANERDALARLVEAARIMDALFLRQVWAGNDAMLQDLARWRPRRSAPRASRSAGARLHYFLINKGPWSRLDHNAPFVPARRPSRRRRTSIRRTRRRPRSRSGSTSLSGDAKRAPRPASSRRSAAAPTARSSPCPTASSTRASWRARRRCCARRRRSPTQPTLKTFLDDARRRVPHATTTTPATSRGWSSTRAIEPTIGPYEVYEDEWFNYKAAFEAFITVRDEAEIEEAAGASAPSCRSSRTTCRSIRSTAIRSSARSRRSASSTWSSPPATATAACRPPPSTCRTTSASSRRRAPSA